jgi:hypothetical protein
MNEQKQKIESLLEKERKQVEEWLTTDFRNRVFSKEDFTSGLFHQSIILKPQSSRYYFKDFEQFTLNSQKEIDNKNVQWEQYKKRIPNIIKWGSLDFVPEIICYIFLLTYFATIFKYIFSKFLNKTTNTKRKSKYN